MTVWKCILLFVYQTKYLYWNWKWSTPSHEFFLCIYELSFKLCSKLNAFQNDWAPHWHGYMNDSNTKNDAGVLSANMRTIYSQELEWCEENKDTANYGSVLEISVSVKNIENVTHVLDK